MFDPNLEDGDCCHVCLGRLRVKKNDSQDRNEKPSDPRVRGNVIDLRGVAKVSEAAVFAMLGDTASELPRVASTRVGIKAYHKKNRTGHRSARQENQTQKTNGTHLSDVPVLRTEASIKKVKLSVLKALHAQSNAGSVNIREVSAALDEVLRKS